jgi:hypothetical protein
VWLGCVNCKSHRHIAASLLFAAALTLLACSKSKSPELAATPPPATPAETITSSSSSTAPDQFACGLLTKEETEAVQGEPFKSTKASQGPGPGLKVSQCYFELPTPVNSIVLTVTRKADGATARDPRESWHELFYGEHPRERESEREKEKEERGEKGPQKVEGIGDEAFWSGSRVGGALYVLKGESYIRISVGGAGDQAQKLEKSKTLAAFVLKRL